MKIYSTATLATVNLFLIYTVEYNDWERGLHMAAAPLFSMEYGMDWVVLDRVIWEVLGE